MKTTDFKVKSNKKLRRYTVTLNGSKYRTLQLSKTEFDNLDYLTKEDWVNYVRTSGNVTALK